MTASPHVLRLREYESASIGNRWDARSRIVSRQVVAELERMQAARNLEYFSISRHRIHAQNFVGVVGVGRYAIEILPKTDEDGDLARRRLLEMLAVAGQLPHLDVGLAHLDPRMPCLLDAVIQVYIRHLALEWRRGHIAGYRKTDENRPCLRGKLLFAEQIRRNRLRPERFFTRADQFLMDVPPARLLKAGLQICRLHATADVTRRDAMLLLAEFDEVRDQQFRSSEAEAVEPDRRIARFAPLLALAKLLVRGCVPDRPGGPATYSLLFDMNAVFEQYIGRLLQRACPPPHRVQLQVSGCSLVRRDGEPKFRLRPDIAVRDGKRFKLIIDTKWKLLDKDKLHEGVKQADMYQAYAYAREFASPCVVLLYPRFRELGPRVASYRLAPGGAECPRIEVMTIDVTQSAMKVQSDLHKLVTGVLAAVVAT